MWVNGPQLPRGMVGGNAKPNARLTPHVDSYAPTVLGRNQMCVRLAKCGIRKSSHGTSTRERNAAAANPRLATKHIQILGSPVPRRPEGGRALGVAEPRAPRPLRVEGRGYGLGVRD